MRCKTMLLGGAVALALSGAAYAQTQQAAPQQTPATDQINAGSAATQSTTGNTATTTATTKTSTHHRHHAVQHHHHVRHHTKTAGLHSQSSPAERRATNDLNAQQLQGGAMTNTSAGGQMNTPAPGTPAPGSENTTMPANPSTGAAPGSENQPNNATYSQPQGSPGMQPGNAGYQQPQNNTGEPTPGYSSSPGAAGPAGTQGNPTTPTDQNMTPPASQNATPPANSNPPGPSS